MLYPGVGSCWHLPRIAWTGAAKRLRRAQRGRKQTDWHSR